VDAGSAVRKQVEQVIEDRKAHGESVPDLALNVDPLPENEP
jgi:hypothetical protein